MLDLEECALHLASSVVTTVEEAFFSAIPCDPQSLKLG